MFHHPLRDDAALRVLEPHHAEALFALIEDNRGFLAGVTPMTGIASVENARSSIKYALGRMGSGNGFAAGVWVHGELAGVVSLPYIHDNKLTELHCWLGESFQDQELAELACRVVITHLFSTRGLIRIQMVVFASDPRNHAVAERLGFTLEATLREGKRLPDGAYTDECLYGLLREEWGGGGNVQS